MSRIINENIIKMRFDNQDFNKNIDSSENKLKSFSSTLTSLPSNISLGLKGLLSNTSLGDILNFAAVTSGIKGIKSEIESIANPIENVAAKAVNAVSGVIQSTITQINVGGKQRALDIAEAKFQIEGLGLSVQNFMEAADYAVSGTAYGLNEAAKVAAQLGASGVSELNELKKALRAVSGVAAMTNRTYSDMGHIFTIVASNGKLMTEQIRSFSYAGLNVTATLAKNLGVTEHEIEEMVKAGAIDFKTFYTAMDEAFGEHAKDANKTFTGAISNIKAALNRIGEGIWTPIIEKSIDTLNTIRMSINDFKAQLTSNEVFKNFADAVELICQKFDKFANNIKKVINETPLLEEVSKVLNNLFEMAKDTVSAFNFDYSLVTNAIAKDFSILVKKIGEVIDAAKEAFNEVFGLWNMAGKFQSFVHWAADLLQLLDNIKKEDVKELFVSWFTALKSVLETIKDILGISKDNLYKVFQNVSDAVVKLINNLKFSDERIDKITRTFKGLASAVDIVKMLLLAIYNNALKPLFSYINPVVDTLLSATSTVGDTLYNLRNSIKEGNVFQNFFDDITEKITKVLELAKKFGGKFIEIFFSGDESGIDKEKGFLGYIADFFGKVVEFIKSIFEDFKIEGIDLSPIQKFIDSFANLGWGEGKTGSTAEEKADKVLAFFEKLSGWVDKVKEILDKVYSNIASSQLINDISNVLIDNFINPIGYLLVNVMQIMSTSASGFATMDSADKRDVLISFFEHAEVVIVKIAYYTYKIVKEAKKTIKALEGTPLIIGIGSLLSRMGGAISAVSSILRKLNSTNFNPLEGVIKSFERFVAAIGRLDISSIIHGKEKVSDVIKAVAWLIVAIAAALVAISLVPENDLKRALITLGVLLAVVGGIITTIVILFSAINRTSAKAKFDKDKGKSFKELLSSLEFFSNPIKGFAELFKSIAIALVAIAASIYIITKASQQGNIWDGFGILMIFLVSITAICVIIAGLGKLNIDPKAGVMASLAAMFVAIGASMLLIGAAVAIIVSSVSSDSGLKALPDVVGSLLGFIAVIGILIAGISAISTKAELAPVVAGVGIMMALAGFCVALLALAKVIKELSKIDSEKLSKVYDVLQGVLILIMVYTTIVSALAIVAGMTEMGSVGLLAMAATLAGVALSIIAIAPVLKYAATLIDAIKDFFTKIVDLMQIFHEMDDTDVDKILRNVNRLYLGIAKMLPTIVTAYITTLLAQLTRLFPVISSFIIRNFLPFLTGIADQTLPILLLRVIKGVELIILTLVEYLPTIADVIYELIFLTNGGGLLGTIFKFLDKAWDDTADWIESRVPQWVEDIYRIIIKIIMSINDVLSENWDELDTNLQDLIDLSLTLLNDLLTGEKTKADIDEMIGNLASAISECLKNNEDKIKEAFSAFGEAMGEALKEGFKASVKELFSGDDEEGFFSKIGNGIKNFFSTHGFTGALNETSDEWDFTPTGYDFDFGKINPDDFVNGSDIDIGEVVNPTRESEPSDDGNYKDHVKDLITGIDGILDKITGKDSKVDVQVEAVPRGFFKTMATQSSIHSAAGMRTIIR